MTAGRLADDIVRFADRWRPDVIVRETTAYGGALAAQILGVASAALQVASPLLLTAGVLTEVAVALDEPRGRLGLAPDPDHRALSEELVICFAPPELHDPSVPLPAGLRSFHPGPVLATASLPDAILGLGRERPLVYAT